MSDDSRSTAADISWFFGCVIYLFIFLFSPLTYVAFLRVLDLGDDGAALLGCRVVPEGAVADGGAANVADPHGARKLGRVADKLAVVKLGHAHDHDGRGIERGDVALEPAPAEKQPIGPIDSRARAGVAVAKDKAVKGNLDVAAGVEHLALIHAVKDDAVYRVSHHQPHAPTHVYRVVYLLEMK